MNSPAVPSFDPNRWYEHASALRALARDLVGDVHAAEDLVQQTMLRALERPPSFSASIRGWLRAVLRNEAKQRFRSDSRRRRRESAVIDSPGVATDDLIAELDGHMLLASAVKALDPIHREAILLRFFEDLPPRRIAERLALPVKTVESRIQRALSRLREELESKSTPERNWIAVLVPLVRPRVAAGIGVLGVMSIKIVSALVVGAAVCVVLAFPWGDEQAAGGRSAQPTDSNSGKLEVPRELSERAQLGEAIERSSQGNAARIEADPVGESQPRGRGVLLDSTGKGMPGIELLARSSSTDATVLHTVSDASGSFEFSGAAGTYGIELVDRAYLLLVRGEIELVDPSVVTESAEATRLRDVTLIAERAGRALGRVVDENQAAIGQANLGIELPERLRVLFPKGGARAALETFTASSRQDGSFEFSRVPLLDGATIEIAKVGFQAVERTLTIGDYSNLEIVMHSVAARKRRLEGIVLGMDGAPIEKAYVAFGSMPARSDAEGRFSFEYDADHPPERILALVKGSLPAIQERPGNGSGVWPDRVELKIEGAPKRIAGIVLGVDGRPLTAGSVMLARSTRIADWHSGSWVAENLIRDDEFLRIQAAIGADGRFHLDGLLDQPYDLRVVDSPRALLVDVGSFRAGDENVVIRLPSDALRARLEGRVIDRRGRPVANAGVRVECAMLAFEDGRGGKYYDSMVGSQTEADAEGRFVLEQVPLADATLDVSHPSLFQVNGVPVPDRSFAGVFEIVVDRRCEVRVAVDPSAGFVKCQLLDDTGTAVSCLREETAKLTYLNELLLFDGASETLVSSDAVVTLRLFRADGTFTDQLVALEAGTLNVLR